MDPTKANTTTIKGVRVEAEGGTINATATTTLDVDGEEVDGEEAIAEVDQDPTKEEEEVGEERTKS